VTTRKILSVKAHDHFLECEMENGDIIKYDMSFIDVDTTDMVAPLKDLTYLKSVFIELGALTWPNGYDIHGNTVARDGDVVRSVAS
jgi:hypothetical protein